MLCLTRHVNEEIVINPGMPDEVVIIVLEVRGDRARLGFSACEDVVIHRREVVESINRQAARKAGA